MHLVQCNSVSETLIPQDVHILFYFVGEGSGLCFLPWECFCGFSLVHIDVRHKTPDFGG